jgi:hypothetical protein
MKTNILAVLAVMLLATSSCALFTKSRSITPEAAQLIAGKWILRTVKQDNAIIPSSKFGEATMEFTKDGRVMAKFPGKPASTGQYYIEKNKIYDIGAPNGAVLDVLSLTNDRLLLEMKANAQKVVLEFEKTL